jgi:hypothetical protein
MTITATKIVEEPTVVVTRKKTMTGEAAPATGEVGLVTGVAAPAADVPVLVAQGNEEAAPAPAEAPAEAPEATHGLSTTAMIGLLCLLGLAAVIGWYLFRKSRSRS